MERSGTSTLGVHPPAAPAGAALPPSVREVSWPSAMTEGETGGAEPRPYTRLSGVRPGVGVSKEGGPQPSLFGRFKGKGYLRKGGNRNPPFLKPFFGYFLSGKKVTRRRQQRRKKEKERESRPQAALLPSIYITPPSRSVHSRRCCGDRPRRRCSSRCCGTRRTSDPAGSSGEWPRRCSWV